MEKKELHEGDVCPAVAVVQTALQVSRFFFDGENAVDGTFGKGTRTAVMRFQEWAMSRRQVAGIVADGIVGPKTMKALQVYLDVDLEGLPDAYWE